MTTSFTETVSKKRGRPAKFDPVWVSIIRGIYPELRSKRQIMAKCYEAAAVGILRDASGVAAIFDKAATHHATILEQLGRIAKDGIAADSEVIAAAQWLSDKLKCDPEFTVRRAVALLRLLREEVAGRWLLGCNEHPMDKLLPLLDDDLMDEVAR